MNKNNIITVVVSLALIISGSLFVLRQQRQAHAFESLLFDTSSDSAYDVSRQRIEGALSAKQWARVTDAFLTICFAVDTENDDDFDRVIDDLIHNKTPAQVVTLSEDDELQNKFLDVLLSLEQDSLEQIGAR